MAFEPSFEPALPVTELTQELRLATTMTGGVSLAIWMAGVAREINLLAQASQWRRKGKGLPDGHRLSDESAASLMLYTKLLDLLDTVVDADVLSGTSAGGINAGLLAWTRVRGSDLGVLRDIWLNLGALTELLRDPMDKTTPSLLYGDQRMLAELAKEIPGLPPGPFPPAAGADPPPTTLYVTTTLLNGETSSFSDSYNTLVQDVDHRGLFTFTEKELEKKDSDAADKALALALALAARSSASFPVAFEPSFVPFTRGTAEQKDVPARPPMADYANITRSHWVADGGLLDNQPIDVLLRRIFDRPAQRAVRRVLLFVVPSSGQPAGVADEPPADDVNDPLGLVDALLKDLSAVTNQSIAADLRTIRDHQDRMEARTDAKLRLAELAATNGSRLLTEHLLTDYETREATQHAQALTGALLRQLGTWPPATRWSMESIPEKWELELKIGGDAERVCRRRIKAEILHRWGQLPQPLPQTLDDLVVFGRPAYDLAKASAIAVVRAAYQLARPGADMTALADFTTAMDAAGESPDPTVLRELVYQVCTSDVNRKKTLGDVAVLLAKHYLDERSVVAEAWVTLGEALVNGSDTMKRLVASVSSDSRADDRVAASHLQTYLNYFGPLDDPLKVAIKLFDLAATQRAMLPAGADIEQSLELVQVSADTRSLLASDKQQSAQDKLTGMQFHHFGAFYKRSWRANDWVWGRLDGAGWLVHVLLDPRRVRWIVRSRVGQGSRVDWFLNELKELGKLDLPSPDGTVTEDMLCKELAFLDNPKAEIPRSIPQTALWLAQAWQRLVLDEELDGLAKAIIEPQEGEPPPWSPADSREWAKDVAAAEPGKPKYDLWKKNPVPDETFATDKGSPLMAQTITKAAATASAAVGSVRQMPGFLKPPLVTARTLALGGYRVVSYTKGVASKTIIIGAVILVLGIAATLLPTTETGAGGLLAALTGGYLIILATWQRSTRTAFALVAFTVVLAVYALTTYWVRTKLFGTDKDNSGIIGHHVYWLGTRWWHPLIVLLVVLIALAVTGIAAANRRRK